MRFFARGFGQPVEVDRIAQLAQDRLDARRLGRGKAAAPDRLLQLVRGRVPHLGPRVEARPEAGVGDVAVRVRRVLGEDRQDELVDRVLVRLVDGRAVHLAQAIADRDDAPLRRALPLGLGRGWHEITTYTCCFRS